MKTIKQKVVIFAMALATAAFFTACSITLPVTATSNEVGTKVGTASATGFLGVFYFDADASIQSAARDGNIRQISTVDIKHTNVLGVIHTYETIVTGE
ncbi:MAG: hypothetical protein EA411_09800 [Saprospirales bacterium]|nr:MAG: hypothetical protein EA411_09800 [Saprospirales bacterium]